MIRLQKQDFRMIERAWEEHLTCHGFDQALGNLKRNGWSKKAVGISEDVFGMSEKNPGRIEDLMEVERALDLR